MLANSKMMNVAKSIKKKDPYSLYSKIQAQSLTSEEIEQKMKGCETAPLWNLAIDTASKEGKSAAHLWKMYNRMKKRHIKPNDQTFTHIFKALADKPAIANNERLLKLFSQIPKPNEIHLQSFSKAICFNGCYDSFFILFGAMKYSNLDLSKLPILTNLPVMPVSEADSKFSKFTPTPQLIKAALGGLTRCPSSVWIKKDNQVLAFQLLCDDILIRAKRNERVLDNLVKLSLKDCLRRFEGKINNEKELIKKLASVSWN